MRRLRRNWLFLVLLVLGVSKTSAQRERAQADQLVVFPPPPDTTRIQFLTSFRQSTDITGKRSGFWRFILGDEAARPIVKPYGIALRHGKLYVCDTMVGGLELIDLNEHTFEYFKPGGLGVLKKPINCFVDDSDFLYVTDTQRRQIVVFNPQMEYVTEFGDPRTMKPTDVFVVGNDIWVCDLGTRKVQLWNRAGYKLVRTFPDAPGKESESLFSPTNIFVTDDKIYVTDLGDFKVKIYDHGGSFVQSIGSYGRALGQFVRPKGISVDKEGNLYVVDAGFENVQIFNSKGKLLMFFGGSYTGKGYMWLPAKIIIDYDNVGLFQKYVYKDFQLKYLIFVTNQYGPDKINVYGFVEPKM